MENSEIALMYSGGLDTTYVALQLAREFSKVHLLTFCNGLCIRVDASKKHALILQEKLGSDKFEHSIIFVTDILSFLKKDLLKDILKYRSPLVFDLCCRLSMEVATILYCLKKNIKFATDGNNPNTQGEMFIQQGKYLKMAADFFSRYDIQYTHPYKHLEARRDIYDSLDAAGIKTGIKCLENIGITSQLFTQPFCLWVPIAFLFTSRLRKIPFIKYFSFSTEEAINLRLKKEKLADIFIDYFRLNSSISRIYPCRGGLANPLRFKYRKC